MCERLFPVKNFRIFRVIEEKYLRCGAHGVFSTKCLKHVMQKRDPDMAGLKSIKHEGPDNANIGKYLGK